MILEDNDPVGAPCDGKGAESNVSMGEGSRSNSFREVHNKVAGLVLDDFRKARLLDILHGARKIAAERTKQGVGLPFRLPSTVAAESSSSCVSRDVAGRGMPWPFGLRELATECERDMLVCGRAWGTPEMVPFDRVDVVADLVKVEDECELVRV